MSVRTLRRRPRRDDAGASAVEFALVAPVLFLILFGIVDYGIWFADSISARQAVRPTVARTPFGKVTLMKRPPEPGMT